MGRSIAFTPVQYGLREQSENEAGEAEAGEAEAARPRGSEEQTADCDRLVTVCCVSGKFYQTKLEEGTRCAMCQLCMPENWSRSVR